MALAYKLDHTAATPLHERNQCLKQISFQTWLTFWVTIFLPAFPHMLTGNEASVKAQTWGNRVDLRHMLPGQVLWNRSGYQPRSRGFTIVSAALELRGVDLTPLVTCGVCANSKAGLTMQIKILWFAYFVLINWTFARLFLQHHHVRSVFVSLCHSFPSFIPQNSSSMNYQ